MASSKGRPTHSSKVSKKASSTKSTSGEEASTKKSRSGPRPTGRNKPTIYNKFVKEHWKTMVQENPGLDAEGMRKRMSEMWKTSPNNPRAIKEGETAAFTAAAVNTTEAAAKKK